MSILEDCIISHLWPIPGGSKIAKPVLKNNYRYISKRRIKQALQKRPKVKITFHDSAHISTLKFFRTWLDIAPKTDSNINYPQIKKAIQQRLTESN